MYSTITWRVFDSLVRRYCKVDHNDPKPLTFRQTCNARLMEIMGVLGTLDDPRYARSHVLHLSNGALYRGNITTINVGNKTITESALALSLGSVLYGILVSAGVYSHVIARVVAINGTTYTVEILSGALIVQSSVTDAYLVHTGLFTGTWDSANLRLRAIRGTMDHVLESSAGVVRPWYQFTRYNIFKDLSKDFGMDGEVGYYNQGGVFQITKGTSADAVTVPVLEFDCVPSLYTENTADNKIELLPEHIRMLFDGVAAGVLQIKDKPQPADLKKRLADDAVRFFGAKREEVARKQVAEAKVNE